MPIAKITGQGLAAIAVSVAFLWACVIGQRSMLREAYSERVRVMREVQLLQRRQQPVPVSLPSPHRAPRVRATMG
ncbi:MAG TPA: hypothetical protein VE959_35705 [Bryobacteraceae bacterium]|nr:hypothetical protein [Bryobacteraceae bacterium]